MNESIDLTKILKDCPEDWKLYSPIYGEVLFGNIGTGDFPVNVKTVDGNFPDYTRDGKLTNLPDSECCLFPSKDCRDWSKFTAPWYKKERFDTKTLKVFDKVMVKKGPTKPWEIEFFSNLDNSRCKCMFCSTNKCIPYNDDTKHLVGTTDEAPEYYRWWEDIDVFQIEILSKAPISKQVKKR